MIRKKALAFLLTLILCLPIFGQQRAAAPKTSAITVRAITYHGWPNSLVMSNGAADVVVVPAIGRVMQFRFAGEEDGPFWDNRSLDGKPPDPEASEWMNFGGDKSWPAPQDDWPRVTGRKWPPPRAFDQMPAIATVRGNELELVTPVDPHYGIRVVRRVQLDPVRPLLTIDTRFEKVQGEPVKVGVWVITQLDEPERVFVPLPSKSRFPQGYNKQTETLPKDLSVERGAISLSRDPRVGTKIGSDADLLVWMDKNYIVRVDSPRVPGREYPDQESSVEVWTNPDPLQYIELETLGPLQTLKVGDRISRRNVYHLARRSEKDPEAELKRLLRR
jgi:hypothetical protein